MVTIFRNCIFGIQFIALILARGLEPRLIASIELLLGVIMLHRRQRSMTVDNGVADVALQARRRTYESNVVISDQDVYAHATKREVISWWNVIDALAFVVIACASNGADNA
jgi:hypothetical protein